MRFFAIILASIAAIAATAQTYFIWSGKGAEVFLAGRNNEASRQLSCRTLLTLSAAARRFSENAEAQVEKETSGVFQSMMQYADKETDDLEVIKERAAGQARQSVIGQLETQVYSLKNFLDVDYMYFSDDELEALGIEEWRAVLDLQQVFGPYYAAGVSTAEEFDAFVAAWSLTAEKEEPIKNACKPILLGTE